jgi:hypothetical protein
MLARDAKGCQFPLSVRRREMTEQTEITEQAEEELNRV